MAVVVHVIIMLVLAGFAITVIGAIAAWLVRLLIRVVIAAGVAITAIVVAVGLGLENWATPMLALAAFALTFWFVACRNVPKSTPPASPVLSPARWMRQHRTIAKAWRDIADCCPEMATELRRAERACATLLRAANSEPKTTAIDLDLIELATLISRHVPELAAGVLAVERTGRFREHRPAQDVARTLVLLGQKAQAMLNRAGRSDAEDFRLRLDHLNRRLRAFEGAHRRSESMGIQ